MPKRRPATRKAPRTPPSVRRGPGLLCLLIAAFVLAAGGALAFRAMWRDLPLSKLQRLDRQAVSQAFAAARDTLSTETRAGLILVAVSDRFTAAWQTPDELPAVLSAAPAALAQVTQTQLGRLQLAALVMLRLQHEDVPVGDWWSSLQPQLAGLDNASFQHFLPQRLAMNTAIYTQLGLGAGTARLTAESNIGFPHGPFLEYFVEQMERVGRARQAAGDPAAATQCRRLVYRLLRQWVLDPGPAALRLLAADLLTRSLADDASDAPPAGSEIVRGLRQWRDTYRDNAGQRPTPLPLVDASYDAVLNPTEYRRLCGALVLNLWLGGALGAAGLATLLFGWLCLRGPAPRPALRRTLLVGLGVAVVMLAIGISRLDFAPDAGQTDLRRIGSNELGWPRQPLVAAALGLALLIAATAVYAGVGTRWQRFGAYVTSACVGLALAFLVAGLFARAETTSYETSLARAYDQGAFAAIAGPDAGRQLDPLRAWNP